MRALYLSSGPGRLRRDQSITIATGQQCRGHHRIDATVHARETNLLGYTVTEHYTVFRNHDEQHPAADMVVKTTYRRDVGKNFSIVSLTGSMLMRKMLEEVLATEKR